MPRSLFRLTHITSWQEGHSICHQYRKLWLVCRSARSQYHTLIYLRKGRDISGTQALAMAEAYTRNVLGGAELRLQDAAFVTCPGIQQEFDLGFRQLLAHGRTWYEGHGYRVVGARGIALRERVRTAVREYKRQSVTHLLRAVQRQVDALQHGRAAYTLVGHDLHTASKEQQGQSCGGSSAPVSQTHVLNARRRLLVLLRSARTGEALGTWLLRLPCGDYEFFMRAMYGGRFPDVPCVAVKSVDGVRTPGLQAFKRANGLRRHSHVLMWRKRLS